MQRALERLDAAGARVALLEVDAGTEHGAGRIEQGEAFTRLRLDGEGIVQRLDHRRVERVALFRPVEPDVTDRATHFHVYQSHVPFPCVFDPLARIIAPARARDSYCARSSDRR